VLREPAPAPGTIAPAPEAVRPTPGIAPQAPECAAPPADHRPETTIQQHVGNMAALWANAKQCSQACTYKSKGKLGQQMLVTTHACTTTTGHLFIADKVNKLQFLIDTG
jgi:hypothetical protein